MDTIQNNADLNVLYLKEVILNHLQQSVIQD